MVKKLLAGMMMIGSTMAFGATKSFNDVSLKDVNGKMYSFKEVKKPKYVKLWASWCPVCLEGLEDTNKLSKEKDNFDVVTVVFPKMHGEKSSEDFIKWYKGLGYNDMTVLLDTKDDIGKLVNVRAYPTTVFLDENNNVVQSFPGGLKNEDIKKIMGDLSKKMMMNDKEKMMMNDKEKMMMNDKEKMMMNDKEKMMMNDKEKMMMNDKEKMMDKMGKAGASKKGEKKN